MCNADNTFRGCVQAALGCRQCATDGASRCTRMRAERMKAMLNRPRSAFDDSNPRRSVLLRRMAADPESYDIRDITASFRVGNRTLIRCASASQRRATSPVSTAGSIQGRPHSSPTPVPPHSRAPDVKFLSPEDVEKRRSFFQNSNRNRKPSPTQESPKTVERQVSCADSAMQRGHGDC